MTRWRRVLCIAVLAAPQWTPQWAPQWVWAQDRPRLMTAAELKALPSGTPDHVEPYGSAESQFGELRVPPGPGPHPVVVLVHGGCFRTPFAGVKSIGSMGEALKKEGIASWSIEYRRLPEDGSGWPGTYRDVAAGVDHLRTLAKAHRLDLSRVVLLGHSAGAHLAHWAAARSRLKPDSALYMPDPLRPAGVLNLAGKMDMTVDIVAYEATCGIPVLRLLVGGLPEQVPEHYAQVSLPQLLPLGVRQVMVWGEHEDYVPRRQVEDYVAAARRAGDEADLIVLPALGHFEIASPASTAWPTVLGAVKKLLASPVPARP